MAEELTLADIQMPFLEYRANYQEPITSIWFDRRQGDIIDALLKALGPQLMFENITWNQAAKNLAEAYLSLSLPSLFSTILVGIRGVTITVLNPDWSRAPVFISVFQTAVDALKTSFRKELEAQQITLGLHLKPGAKPFRESISRFVNSKALAGEDAKLFGVSVYYPDYAFVIDSSASIPDGVFVKIVRTFSREKRFEEMAPILYKDEEAVLHRLGLKLE
jgi:hypothetical protein